MPDISIALRPDSIDRLAVEPPICRRSIPVRSIIHSSDVSRVLARSAFVTTFSGSARPQPVIMPLTAFFGIFGIMRS
ncbi:unannotated protein [freshwater metagenome]|uniref:Unannotated protein n=1 Tax=freshwater metagenome TaxID=449393 RepID=A0A6J6UTL9_9ZZZZ